MSKFFVAFSDGIPGEPENLVNVKMFLYAENVSIHVLQPRTVPVQKNPQDPMPAARS